MGHIIITLLLGITLVEYNNFKAGEGKTVLDTHFAHVSHKIVRWVRVGNNLESREQLANLLEVFFLKKSLLLTLLLLLLLLLLLFSFTLAMTKYIMNIYVVVRLKFLKPVNQLVNR